MKTSFLIWTSRLRTDRCSTTPQRLVLGENRVESPDPVHRRPSSAQAPPIPFALSPSLRRRSSARARGSARRRLLPRSVAPDPLADSCSLGPATAGEESPTSARAGPRARRYAPQRPLPGSAADPQTATRHASLGSSSRAAVGEEGRPLHAPPPERRVGLRAAVWPAGLLCLVCTDCFVLCARWITYEHATSD
jgi:hypothetical protein